MIFCFRRVRLKIHLLLLSLWVISFISGNGLHILATILALLFHEGGHLFMARIMKISVTEIEIMPHGGLMILDGIEEAIPPLPLFFMAFASVAICPFLFSINTESCFACIMNYSFLCCITACTTQG